MVDCGCSHFPASLGNVTIEAALGVGTTTPGAKVHVAAATPTSGGGSRSLMQLFDTSASAAGVGPGIAFGGNYGVGASTLYFANITGIKENATAGDYASALTFFTRQNGVGLTEAMRIASTGNLGIGTTNPQAPLQVGDASVDHSRGVVRLATCEGGGARSWDIGPSPELGWGFGIRDASDPSAVTNLKLYIAFGSGNVGLGTDSPQAKLDVRVPAGAQPAVHIRSAGAGGGDLPALQWLNASGVSKLEIWTDMSAGHSRIKSAGALSLHTNGTGFDGTKERLVIDNAGNVGIGAAAPQALLQVGDDQGAVAKAGVIRVGTTNGGGGARLWDMGVSHAGNWNFSFAIVDVWANRPAITARYSTGNVGINTWSAAGQLDVQADANQNETPNLLANPQNNLGTLTIKHSNGTPSIRLFADTSNSYARLKSAGALALHAGDTGFSGTNEFLTILTNGNVGIGTTNPQFRLHVNGHARVENDLTVTNNASVLQDLTVVSSIRAGSPAIKVADGSGCYYA